MQPRRHRGEHGQKKDIQFDGGTRDLQQAETAALRAAAEEGEFVDVHGGRERKAERRHGDDRIADAAEA